MVAATTPEKKPSKEFGGLSIDEIKRLTASMRQSRRRYAHFRRNRQKIIRSIVGKHYSTAEAGRDTPINILGLYQRIMKRSLVADNPRVMISTFDDSLQPHVSKMEGWCNDQFKRMYLADSLQQCVVDAFYSFGIIKTGISTPAGASSDPYGRNSGDVWAERIDPDDVVFDFRAKNFHHCTFVGHRYRCPVDDLKELYKKYTKTKEGGADPFVATDDYMNEDGDPRIGTIGRGHEMEMGSDNEFVPMADVWEVYLPRQRKVITFRSRDGGLPSDEKDVIGVDDYIGPACGPYTFIGYEIVPGNLVPKGPAQDLYDIHIQLNRSLRKLMQGADRLKSTIPVRGGQVDEAGNLKQAADGEFFEADNADTIRELVTGGPNPVLTVFVNELKNLFSWLAGNLDVTGGLSSQAGTATQEKLLNANAGGTVASMATQTNIFAAAVIENLCWYFHRNPTQVMQTKYPMPGIPGEYISRTLTPDDRAQVPWEAMELKIDPYSMNSSTPEAMLAFVRGFVNELMPVMPLLQGQGMYFDADYYLRTVSRLGNMPDLTRIFKLMEPQTPDQAAAGGGSEGPGMPSATHRVNERVSTSQQTKPGQDRTMATTVLGQASRAMANGNGNQMSQQ